MKQKLRQSVCRWCYEKTPLEKLAKAAAGMGLAGIDLVLPADWEVLKRHGLIGTMTPSHTIEVGLNDPANHAGCLAAIEKSIELTSAAGFPNVICFSGNRARHLDDEIGLKNCAKAIKKVVGLAEKKKITLHMELLNSKLNHPHYMCDRTHWGAELVHRVGSERFKLLYDIYHMQVQEGDVCATISKYKDCIGHYHTGGCPGRNEINASQELFYPAIIKTIAATGFKGFLAHEFIPKGKPLDSLREAVGICDL